MSYIIELEKGCWRAVWSGDPGRTYVISSARQYPSLYSATLGLAIARKYRPFLGAVIYDPEKQEDDELKEIAQKLQLQHGPDCHCCQCSGLRNHVNNCG